MILLLFQHAYLPTLIHGIQTSVRPKHDAGTRPECPFLGWGDQHAVWRRNQRWGFQQFWNHRFQKDWRPIWLWVGLCHGTCIQLDQMGYRPLTDLCLQAQFPLEGICRLRLHKKRLYPDAWRWCLHIPCYPQHERFCQNPWGWQRRTPTDHHEKDVSVDLRCLILCCILTKYPNNSKSWYSLLNNCNNMRF